MRPELAVDDADERNDAAVLVVRGVEDERARRRLGVAGRRRDALDDRIEDLLDALARLRRDAQHPVRIVTDELGELARRSVRIRLRKVDLVDDGKQLEVVLDREVGVGDRLGLDALRGVDHEHRALARLERTRDLVGEIDMPRRVDQVQLVALPLHADGLGLDRDPRSRSRSIESSTCARMSRPVTVFVTSRMRSASVDFPWSMWAMIEKLRMRLGP